MELENACAVILADGQTSPAFLPERVLSAVSQDSRRAFLGPASLPLMPGPFFLRRQRAQPAVEHGLGFGDAGALRRRK